MASKRVLRNVSVIMPARNESRRVEATLRAILSQSVLPSEIVVADGQSTDDTVARVRRFASPTVPIRLVSNARIFAGAGRNEATRAAESEIIVNADFGNIPAPNWLEEMTRPFEEDEGLELLGGMHYPLLENPMNRVTAAIVYTHFSEIRSLSQAELARLLPEDFVPGGMCMAYRKEIWRRAGGFCEWARKGQDRLFGYRVRRLGGKVSFTFQAVVRHHMPNTLSELFDRQFHYLLWLGRTGLPESGRFLRLSTLYALGGLLLLGCLVVPWLLWIWAFLVLLYAVLGAWRKLEPPDRDAKSFLLAPVVLAVRDGAVLLGGAIGTIDRWLRPRWRRKTEAYLETGA